MSKRNITYTKPEEPNFLKRLKEQAGYKEGPTVDTKREDFGPVSEEDFVDTEEEQPTVVVLKAGDLTAEEAARIQEIHEKEKAEAPADLNKPIVFKAPKKSKQSENLETSTNKRPSTSKASKQPKKQKTVLSFNHEEEEED